MRRGISEANEISRKKDASATTSSGRASLEPERRSNVSTGKGRLVVLKPEVGESGISEDDSEPELEDEEYEQTSVEWWTGKRSFFSRSLCAQRVIPCERYAL